jgi:lysyl endopeptidase
MLLGMPAVAETLRLRGEIARASFVDGKYLPDVSWQDKSAADLSPVRFKEIEAKKLAQIRQENARIKLTGEAKAFQIGIDQANLENALDPDYVSLQWHGVPGGFASSVGIVVPGARGVRSRIVVKGIARQVQLRFGSARDQTAATVGFRVGDVESQVDSDGSYWTPLTEGDVQRIELFSPTGFELPKRLRILSATHFIANAKDGFSEPKASGVCQVNVACATQTPEFANAKNAVAQMVYQASGGSFLCTGNLLNDVDAGSQTPFLFTASHCINNASSALTLITYWFYENATCAPAMDVTRAQSVARYGGALLLHSSANSDIALLRLNEQPPAGVWYSGWDANQIAPGAAIQVIHHPAGDPKKYSVGQVTGLTTNFIRVGYTSGSTEGGSSGSGLLTLLGGEYFVRGGLQGGSSSCSNSGSISNPGNVDSYSRIDLAFPVLRRYLVDAPPVVSPSASSNGTVSPDVGTPTPYGTSQVFVLNPASGFAPSVSGTCGGNLYGNIFVTSPVTQSCTVDVTFQPGITTLQSFTGTGAGAIPDSTQSLPQVPTGSRVVSFNVSGIAETLTGVGITIGMRHTYVGDLRIVLTSPGGERSVALVQYPGASSSGFYGSAADISGTYHFADDLTASFCWSAITGFAILPGAYRAHQAFGCENASITGAFADLPPSQLNGTWTLTFSDGTLGDVGHVSAATLHLATPGGTVLAIEDPDSINANATYFQDFKVRANFSGGGNQFVSATWAGASDAAKLDTGTGRLFVGGSGSITITATVQMPGGPPRVLSKAITITDGPTQSAAIPYACTQDASVASPGVVLRFPIGTINDFVPICGNTLLVSHNRLGKLQALDLSSGVVLGSWPTNGKPQRLLHRPDTGAAYVTTDAGIITRVNLNTGQTVSVAPPGGTGGMAFGELGEVWVVTFPSGSVFESWLARLDEQALNTISTVKIPAGGSEIQYDRSRRLLFMAGLYTATGLSSAEFNPSNGGLTLKQSNSGLGGDPSVLTMSPDFQHLAMTVGGGNGPVPYTTADINPADISSRFGTWHIGPYPSGGDFRFDSTKFLTSDTTRMLVFDVATHALDQSIPTSGCTSVRVLTKWSPGGRNAYLSKKCIFEDGFSEIHVASLAAPNRVRLTAQRSGLGTGTVVSQPFGIACGDECAAMFVEAAVVSLTAIPSPGSRFRGWGAGTGNANCTGLGPCVINLNAESSIQAIFDPVSAPSAPQSVMVLPGDGRFAISFGPPLDDGGSPITRYQISCDGGLAPLSASFSPALISGVTNGISYSCTVTAINANGESAPSAPVIAVPSASAPLSLVAAYSRKQHGSAGQFDLPINISFGTSGALSFEPRSIGSGHKIFLVFSRDVSSVGSVTATNLSSGQTVGSATAEEASGRVLVTLRDVDDGQRVRVVVSAIDGVANAVFSIGFLLGDSGGTGVVTAADVARTKAMLGQSASLGTFSSDFNLSGGVNDVDLRIVKSRSGSRSPP